VGKYLGSTCRLARREKTDLFLKARGRRPLESKCRFQSVPGQHAGKSAKRSEYYLQLREKQKVKRIYGVREEQFRRLYNIASSSKQSTGYKLLELLERRLDNVVYRMGVAATRAEARQLVSHRAVLVNGKILNIPSFTVEAGDQVTLTERGKQQERVRDAFKLSLDLGFPGWIDINEQNLMGSIKKYPERADIYLDIKEQLIVELYSR
jgi:small subunit ribosomal protein S4